MGKTSNGKSPYERRLLSLRRKYRVQALDNTIRGEVLQAIERTGNIVLAGELLGIGKTTIYRYLKQWGGY